MATKEAVFSLRVDTGNSVQDIQNADNAVKNFNKDLKETQVTAASGTGVDKMQADLQALNAKVEAGGLTMRQMTQAMKEYQSIAAQAGIESPVGQAAIQSAAALKDRIGDLKNATTALSSDFVKLDTTIAAIGVGASVFQGLSSAISLSGIENEQLTKTMVKLQAVQGVSNAISQISNALNKDAILGIQLRNGLEKIRNLVLTGTTAATASATAAEVARGTATVGATVATQGSTMAMKLLRVALISTGIGALVVGIGLLISNFDKVKTAVLGAYDQFTKLGPAVKTVISIVFPLIGAIFGVIKALEYFGVIDDETTRKNKANAEAKKLALEKQTKALDEQIIAFEKANAKRLKSYSKEDDAMARQIALLKAQGKETYELERTRIKGAISHQQGLIRTTYLQYQSVRAIQAQQKAELEGMLQFAKLQKDDALLQSVTNKLKEDLAKLTEKETKILDENQTAQKSLLDSQNDLAILEAEHAKDARERAKEKSENAKEEAQKVKDISKEIEDAKIKTLADGQEKELELIRVQYERKKIDLEKQVKEGTVKRKQADELIAQDIIQQGIDEKKIIDKYTQDRIKKEDEEWLKKQAIDLSKQEYEKLVLMQKFDDESLLTQDIEKLTREHLEALKAIDDKYNAEAETKRQNRSKILNQNLLNESDQAIQNEINSFNNQKKELDKFLLSKDENEKITQEQHDLALIELEKKKTKKIAEIKKKADEDAKVQAQKAREEELKGISDAIATADKALEDIKIVNDLLNEIGTARINKINEERDEDLLNLDAQKQAELNVEGLTAEQKTGIEEKFAKQKYAVQLDAFNKEDKINRAKFNRDKAIKLAEVGMNTASAIVKGIAEFGPPPSPAGIAAIATAGIIGTTQALAIANQKYQGGTMPTMPSVSSSGGGGLAGSSASSFTSQPTTQTSTTGLTGGQSITAPVQVFVLENDISSTQNKVALQESKSSF